MVKRKPTVSSKMDEDQSDQAEYEATQSEDYITGTTDATEDESVTGLSDTEHETTVLSRPGATRSPSVPSTSAINAIGVSTRGPRRSARLLRKKRQTETESKIDDSSRDVAVEQQGDSAGMYGIIKGAIQDITSEIMSAIQMPLRGNPSSLKMSARRK